MKSRPFHEASYKTFETTVPLLILVLELTSWEYFTFSISNKVQNTVKLRWKCWNKIVQLNVSFDSNSAALLTEDDAVLIDLAMATMFRHAAGITTILLYCLYYGPDADLSSEIVGEFKRNKLGVPYCVQKCITQLLFKFWWQNIWLKITVTIKPHMA